MTKQKGKGGEVRRSTRLRVKNAPSTAVETKAAQKFATFSDLPTELHMLIFNELTATYNIAIQCKDPISKSKVVLLPNEILPLAFLSPTWRALVQRWFFADLSLRAEDLPRFLETAKKDPNFLTYSTELVIKSAAGDSKDHDGTEKRDEESEQRALRNNNTYYFKDVSPVLVSPQLSLFRRTTIFKDTWFNIGTLFSLIPPGRSRLTSLTIHTDDMLKGRLNGQIYPQYSFLPNKDSGEYAMDLKLHPLPQTTLETLTIDSQVLENIELDPDIVSVIIQTTPNITSLRLRTSDIRALRTFRKEVYDGLVNTIVDITLNKTNLTSLHLYYPSSFSRHRYFLDTAFALADRETDTDPLSAALHELSTTLIDFSYDGRISKHLFSKAGTKVFWPRMRKFQVTFECVDAFGRMMVEGIEGDGFWDECSGCISCGCASIQKCWDDYTCEERNSVAHQAAKYPTLPDVEEGIDSLVCEGCRNAGDKLDWVVKKDIVNELFAAASEAMLGMPKIAEFNFSSSDDIIHFEYNASKQIATVAKRWWKPNDKAMAIWHGRFPELRLKSKKLCRDIQASIVELHSEDLLPFGEYGSDSEFDSDILEELHEI